METKNIEIYAEAAIKKLAEEGITACKKTIQKNGVKTIALVITGEAGIEQLCPVIYFSENEPVEDYVKRVKATLNLPLPALDVNSFLDREFILDHARICVQPPSDEQIVKNPFLNLETYLRLILPEIEASAKLDEDVINLLEIDKEELWDVARANTFSTSTITPMSNFFGGDDLLYVVSNKETYYGAGVISSPEVFTKFCYQNGIRKCLILPSSIHELVVYPISDGESIDPKEFYDVVCTVNKTELTPDIFLADAVYLYDKETNKVTLLYDQNSEKGDAND